MNCYHLDTNHSKDTSSEHIFPQQIGGKKKISGILCKKHNNLFGHTIEAELESKLDFFCILLDVDRKNKEKKYYLLETAERKVKVFADRKGKLEKTKVKLEKDKDNKLLSINIESNTKSELEETLKKIKEKYKLANDISSKSKIYDIAVNPEDFTENKIKIPIYEKSTILCMAKTIINFALSKEIDNKLLEPLIEFVCKKREDINCFTTHLSPLNDVNNVDNVIIIVGQDNKIVSYVQYLNLIKYYFILNENYTGPPFSFNFTENPEGRGHHEETKFDSSKIINPKYPIDSNIEDFKEAFYPFMNRVKFKREFNQLIDKHIKRTRERIGEGANAKEFLNQLGYEFILEYISKFENQNGA